ncbi:hypothetical protein BH23CHL2_BH23CHL2_12120 [soil metagenome]
MTFAGGPVEKHHIPLLLAIALVCSAVVISCTGDESDSTQATATQSMRTSTSTPAPTPTATPTPIPELGIGNTIDRSNVDVIRSEDLNAFGHYDEVRVSGDGTRHLIPLSSIEWGGVAKDGIPALDRPDYVGPERWSQMVYDSEGLVIGVEVDGKYRAYPLQILIWHEIVNETFDGKHLLVTY